MICKVRRGVFETNSSSTHSVCISKKSVSNLSLPKTIIFKPAEFGWSFNILNTPEEKASYLYSAFFSMYPSKENVAKISEWKNYLYEALNKYGIEAEFIEPENDGSSHPYCDVYNSFVYDSEYKGFEAFIKAVRNEKHLIRFLFSSASIVITGNDNSEMPIQVWEKKREIWKNEDNGKVSWYA